MVVRPPAARVLKHSHSRLRPHRHEVPSGCGTSWRSFHSRVEQVLRQGHGPSPLHVTLRDVTGVVSRPATWSGTRERLAETNMTRSRRPPPAGLPIRPGMTAWTRSDSRTRRAARTVGQTRPRRIAVDPSRQALRSVKSDRRNAAIGRLRRPIRATEALVSRRTTAVGRRARLAVNDSCKVRADHRFARTTESGHENDFGSCHGVCRIPLRIWYCLRVGSSLQGGGATGTSAHPSLCAGVERLQSGRLS
jgi:hypothetical protein